ncbi:hypothetical protein MPTK1_6g16660 [Marchantia polymorpha subsp. ruderalis]|uniref:Uncharacterized protein n=2 Tax=Marchantia polymorpha TaxID=3197 RepID=A0AAF6BSS6_MARPO|nr:hypothetical protein MARPO_0170s0011 [Marchantia polymorpha]BBN15060.1 hypothetical protein Mp_6g16660 [Marchantia polymorpha subsp. ruderalis]|eukprot:PTQ28207.1 hypothetical protein MARPO_0170s0011 [Marchantia polymorpha]
MSILLALSFLALFQLPHLSSAVPGGYFRFQRFSAAELRQSLGLESLKLDDQEFSNAAVAELVVPADECRSNRELAQLSSRHLPRRSTAAEAEATIMSSLKTNHGLLTPLTHLSKQ